MTPRSSLGRNVLFLCSLLGVSVYVLSYVFVCVVLLFVMFMCLPVVCFMCLGLGRDGCNVFPARGPHAGISFSDEQVFCWL